MSWGWQNSATTKPLPSSWKDCVAFKLMKPGDRIGYIDTIPGKTTFKLVTAGMTPLSAFAPKMPFDCPTLASIHASNKLTLTVKLNERVWHSLDDLDREFDRFLLDNSNKLFGPSESDYLKKNPGAISLKRAKRLAPVDPSGQPIFDANLSLRIGGRVLEVESVQTAEGPRGTYISGVTWAARTAPLPPSATRFSKITGHTAVDFNGSSMPIVRDTLPEPLRGGGHVRFVGPGDISPKCLIHHALIRPAYWTNVGGGFMITLAADHVIFENTAGEDRGSAGGSALGDAHAVPDGFARDPQERETGLAAFNSAQPEAEPERERAFSSSSALTGDELLSQYASRAPAPKRRITLPGLPEGSISMGSRSITGGGTDPAFRAFQRSMSMSAAAASAASAASAGAGAAGAVTSVFGDEDGEEDA